MIEFLIAGVTFAVCVDGVATTQTVNGIEALRVATLIKAASPDAVVAVVLWGKPE